MHPAVVGALHRVAMKISDLKQAMAQRRLRERPSKVQVERERSEEPRLPHEHDESADSQVVGSEQARVIGRAAFDDLRAGRVDTDRGPVMERLHRTLQELPAPTAPPAPIAVPPLAPGAVPPPATKRSR